MKALSPFRQNVKDKHDVLDRGRLPSEPCDLNFRPPTRHALDQSGSALGLLLKTSLIAGIAAELLRHLVAGVVLSGSFAVSAIVAGGVLGVTILSGLFRPTGNDDHRTIGAALGVVSVPLLWMVVVVVFFAGIPALSVLLLVCVGFPLTARLSDRMATHFVYWQSSNPKVDRHTMLSWRADWRRRFRRQPDRRPWRQRLSSSERQRVDIVMRLRRAYRRGFVGVAGCFLLAPLTALFVNVSGESVRTGFWIGLQIPLGLAALAGWRLWRTPCSVDLFWQALSSWTWYGKDLRRTPTMFRSPAGMQLVRQVSVIAIVALLSTLLLPVIHADPWFAGAWNTGSALVDITAPLTLVLLASVLWPVVVFLLAAYVIMAPAITAHHLALDAEDAYEQHWTWTELDGYADRLQRSDRQKQPVQHKSLICGYNPQHEYPYLLDLDLLFEHMHVLGATGIGKTALGLLTLVTQLVRRNDGPVIVIDAKGDRALFNSVRIEAQRAGRTFKWFTNKPRHSTYVFNPFAQRSLKQLTLPEILGVVTQSLNLYHGEDYARAWFSIAARVLFRAALLATMPQHAAHRVKPSSRKRRRPSAPVESFRDLEVLIREAAGDDEEYRAAKHLAFLVQSLCDFEQLNLSPRRNPDHPAVKHAIHMPDVINNNEVVYFFLTGMADVASVAQISRLVLYSVLTAAMAHRDTTRQKPRIYLMCDEAQVLVGRNIENVMAQAREFGMACILSHQAMDQLKSPGGADLRQLVTQCTSVKQHFSARDQRTQEELSAASGSVYYVDLKWNQLKDRVVTQGDFGTQFACTDPDGVMRIGVEQKIGPRLTIQDILDINRDPNKSVFLVERSEGYSQYQGAFPMHTTWPISKQEHTRRSFEIPWPEESDATITLLPDWPEPNDETVVAQPQPTSEGALGDREIQKLLGAIRDEIKERDDS